MSNDRKVAEYLATLDERDFYKFCEFRSLDPASITPFVFEAPEQVFECLMCFLDEGIDRRYLFNAYEPWNMYLLSITEERFHDGISLMLSTEDPSNLIYFLRACYRFGFPAVDDQTFDVLEKLYIMAYPQLEFFNQQTYDDDKYSPLVMDAIKMSGAKVNRTGTGVVSRTDLSSKDGYDELNRSKTTSIRPVVSPEEAFEFWCNAPECDVLFSLKIDGVNTKMTFNSDVGGLKLALSRGRATNSIDYTEAVRTLFRVRGIDESKFFGPLVGESFVPLDKLPIIQSRYPDKDYKTPKSTAMAMLRAPDKFSEEDYVNLEFRAFTYGDMSPDQAYNYFTENEMPCAPYMIKSGKDIPRTSLEEFNTWMEENVLSVLWDKGQELSIGSDGVVMYLLAEFNTERKDKYSDNDIAIKYDRWAAKSYTSKVTNIIFDQRRVEASIVLEIEPVVTRDGNTATRVGVGSPDILIADNVRIGDIVEFERKSEAYNVYLAKIS